MNIFKGLLFLEGHFTRSEDLDETPRAAYGAATAADELAPPLGNRAASAAWLARSASRPVRTADPALPEPASAGLFEHLLYLGGRPMHAGHNADIDEPFEQLAPPRAERRVAPRAAPQACTG